MPPHAQVLPPTVSLGSSLWFGRARSFPVFSAPWYRYRSQAHILGLFLMFCASSAVLGLTGRGGWAVSTFVMGKTWIPMMSFSLIGPGLAVLVHRRGLSARRELAALAGALVLGLVLSVGAMKLCSMALAGTALAQSAEQERTARHAESASETAPGIERTIAMAVVGILFFAWLGGGFELLAFVRQRDRLASLSRDEALASAQAARNEAELRLAVLAAQIEPHFLFNTLAGVRSAINVDPARATTMVDHLVDYLRATIPQMRSEGNAVQVDLNSQLEAARAFLGLMRARMPRLAFEVSAGPGLERAAMPPLLLISLIENAVKHGIEPKIGPGMVRVAAVRRADGMLEVCVSDDGVGFGGVTSGDGIGLANITRRLETLFGTQAGLTLKARPGGGVDATIHLPFTEYNS